MGVVPDLAVFGQREVEEARDHAGSGGVAAHLHRIIVDRRKAPRCFVAAVDRGEPICHLVCLDAERLRRAARVLGVNVVVIDRPGQPMQHIDLCGGPMWKLLRMVPRQDDVRRVLAEFKAGWPPRLGGGRVA